MSILLNLNVNNESDDTKVNFVKIGMPRRAAMKGIEGAKSIAESSKILNYIKENMMVFGNSRVETMLRSRVLHDCKIMELNGEQNEVIKIYKRILMESIIDIPDEVSINTNEMEIMKKTNGDIFCLMNIMFCLGYARGRRIGKKQKTE